MLPRFRRITTSLFAEILAKGRSSHSTHFTFRFVREQEGPSRFSVAVSKKVAKKAVVRNRFRRRAREALRTHLPSLPDGLHGVLFVKEPIDSIIFTDLVAEIGSLLKKTLT